MSRVFTRRRLLRAVAGGAIALAGCASDGDGTTTPATDRGSPTPAGSPAASPTGVPTDSPAGTPTDSPTAPPAGTATTEPPTLEDVLGDRSPIERSGSVVRIEDGAFAVGGEPFAPVGFNYIRVRELGENVFWHDTFNPNSYDAGMAEAMFADLADRGFSLVRVFLDHKPGTGIIQHPTSTSFAGDYLANLFDFLGRAREHGLYVLVTFTGIPRRQSYIDLLDDGPPAPHVGGKNRRYLERGHVLAKAAYVADVLAAIRDADPALLETVFAVHLENESSYHLDEPPFTREEGTVTLPTGEAFDLSGDGADRRLADAGTGHWLNTCRRAARAVVADMPVTTDVFPYNAVGLDGPDDFTLNDDGRYPANPLVIAGSEADYVDVHTYPHYSDAGTLEARRSRILDSIAFDRLRERLLQAGKPLVTGEFGANDWEYDTAGATADAMASWWGLLREVGFDGFAYWTYAANGQRNWMGTDDDGQIIDALTEAVATGDSGEAP